MNMSPVELNALIGFEVHVETDRGFIADLPLKGVVHLDIESRSQLVFDVVDPIPMAEVTELRLTTPVEEVVLTDEEFAAALPELVDGVNSVYRYEVAGDDISEAVLIVARRNSLTEEQSLELLEEMATLKPLVDPEEKMSEDAAKALEEAALEEAALEEVTVTVTTSAVEGAVTLPEDESEDTQQEEDPESEEDTQEEPSEEPSAPLEKKIRTPKTPKTSARTLPTRKHNND